MDPGRRRALSDFYREEFVRHLRLLESHGLLHAGNRGTVAHACDRFLSDLDSVCWRADFPIVAESLLQNLDTLTHLSELEPHRGH